MKKFEEPAMNIIKLASNDAITTSGVEPIVDPNGYTGNNDDFGGILNGLFK